MLGAKSALDRRDSVSFSTFGHLAYLALLSPSWQLVTLLADILNSKWPADLAYLSLRLAVSKCRGSAMAVAFESHWQ